jgi:hypothetical protein
MAAIGLALLYVTLSVAFTTGCMLIGRKLVTRHVSSSHNQVMISLFASASVVYAVLLGFLVVVVWESYDSAHRNVALEAANLVPLYRLTDGMEQQNGAALRGLIRAYANAVVTDEWPLLGTARDGSRKARRAIGDMDRHFADLSPATKISDAQVDAEFLRTKSAIVADRNERLLEASSTIPWVMWLGALGGAIITTMMSSFIYMSRVWPHVIMAGLAGALTGLLLFIMTVLSSPFRGPLALGPEYFVSALNVLDDVDRGY